MKEMAVVSDVAVISLPPEISFRLRAHYDFAALIFPRCWIVHPVHLA